MMQCGCTTLEYVACLAGAGIGGLLGAWTFFWVQSKVR